MRKTLLMSTMAMALAASPCLAQSHAGDTAAVASEAQPSPAQPSSARAEPEPGAAQPKSAFGRVMDVLIAALVQKSTRESRPQKTKASSATATSLPISIDVGEAFQPAIASAAATTKEEAMQSLDATSATSSEDSDAAPQSTEPLALQGDGK